MLIRAKNPKNIWEGNSIKEPIHVLYKIAGGAAIFLILSRTKEEEEVQKKVEGWLEDQDTLTAKNPWTQSDPTFHQPQHQDRVDIVVRCFPGENTNTLLYYGL